MLKNDLYKIAERNISESVNVFTVDIDPGHKIFSGHFPGQPVLPGVCQIEMVKELLAEVTGKPMKLLSSSNIKYIEIVDPNRDPRIQVELTVDQQPEGIKVSAASLFEDGRANFKFSGVFN